MMKILMSKDTASLCLLRNHGRVKLHNHPRRRWIWEDCRPLAAERRLPTNGGREKTADHWQQREGCRPLAAERRLPTTGSTVSDPSAIAEAINNYFSNIASNLDSNIPDPNISTLNFLGSPVENSFFCPPSDREEIDNLIRSKRTNPLTSWIFRYLYIIF